MDALDSLSQGLLFNATQGMALQAGRAQKKEEVKKTKKSFASAMEKARVEQQFLQEGFPVEIASMEVEDAAVFLKDAADIAADKLKENQSPENFASYKKAVSQFVRYLVKNNFDVVDRKRIGRNKLGRKIDPHKSIVIINEKLDELGRWLLTSHKETLEMLRKLDEIKGMMVDLMAV